jgi:hypothetical protein
MPVRFGRRRAAAPVALEIRVEHVRRGVAALHELSHEARADPEARGRCLVRALRGVAHGMPLEMLVVAISRRIAAFERMLANRPRLLGGRKASADLEHAVYVAIATEPLLTGAEGRGFDPPGFVRRVDDVLATLARRRVAAAAPSGTGDSPTEAVAPH